MPSLVKASWLAGVLVSFAILTGATARVWSQGVLLGKAETQTVFKNENGLPFNSVHSFVIRADKFTLLVVDTSSDMDKQRVEGDANILFAIDADKVYVLGDDKTIETMLIRRVTSDPDPVTSNTTLEKSPLVANRSADNPTPTVKGPSEKIKSDKARDDPRAIIQVVDSRATERYFNQYIPGTAGHSSTNCNGNATVYGGGGIATANGTTNCQTTTTPGRAPTTIQRSIEQMHVLAVMPDGRRITLWCQAGFRRCNNLLPGSYETEIKGNTVWVYTHDLDGITEHRVKYRFVGGW